MTEKQLFSTGPTGCLSSRLLMTSIWCNHRFPVALIKSRLIKTFAIRPALTLQAVFFTLFSFYFDHCVFPLVEAGARTSTENNSVVLHPHQSLVSWKKPAALLDVADT